MDIETAALEWDDLTERLQEKLVNAAERKYPDSIDPESRAKDLMSLSPMTSKVIVIGFEKEDGSRAVLLESEIGIGWKDDDPDFDGAMSFHGTEKQLLEQARKILDNSRPQMVTFNGRRFDVPFLSARAMINKCGFTFNDYMGSRFTTTKHFDALEVLTCHGAAGFWPSFDAACWAFGLESPKEGGMDGAGVGAAYRDGKIDDIARYCMRDVRQLSELKRRM